MPLPTHTQRSVKALERQKTAGSAKNAEEILEEVQEEVIARHREDLQKQTKKINSLVGKVTIIIIILEYYFKIAKFPLLGHPILYSLVLVGVYVFTVHLVAQSLVAQ